MLDQDLIEQLKSVYESLEAKIELVYFKSNHTNQSELVELLTGLTKASNKIVAVELNQESDVPRFYIQKNGQKTGIAFTGIPGGHEFTSLVLAILNADGKGKLPDGGVAQRIKNLKGPVRIQTYVSLTCENCPDVVQALNQMAVIHPDFQHEMIDGGYRESDIQRLGIQGVPSVVINDKMIHSGRITFLDLLVKLEDAVGKNESAVADKEVDLGNFDVVVIGGGPAGVSAAIYSARKGLSVAVIAERMGGQVQDTKGIENLISVVYTEGPELAAAMQKHMMSYQVKCFEQRRVKSMTADKKIFLEGGEFLTGSSIIIATGAKWRELNVPGEKDYMGRGVAYCPHCDGPFYKGKSVAVIGGGNSGVEAAIDLAGIVKDVVLLEYGDKIKADQVLVDKLKSLPNTRILTNAKTLQVLGNGEKVVGLEYEDRVSAEKKTVNLDGIFVQIGLLPNSSFAKGVVETTQYGEIQIDIKGRTNIPGIYAAGDVTTVPYKQIVIAMGEGSKAALTSFEDRMKM